MNPQPATRNPQLVLVPYVQVDGAWTMSDEVMRGLWAGLEAEGTVRRVWCGGGMLDADEFLMFMKRPSNAVHVIWEEAEPVFLAWLNSFGDNHAMAHFAGFMAGWGRIMVECLKKCFQYWFSMKNGDEKPLFGVILGIIPETNRLAIRLGQRAGARRAGTVPGVIRDIYQQRRVGAAIMYVENENGRRI